MPHLQKLNEATAAYPHFSVKRTCFVCQVSSSGFYALHESTVIDGEPEPIMLKDYFSDQERGGSELELKNLASTPSVKASPSPNLSPIPTPEGGLSDSDVKRTITTYLSLKRKESSTSQSSIPKLLRHFSNTSAKSPPPTALSRPLTSSTRPVTPSTQTGTSSNHEKKTVPADHTGIGEEGSD